jgi:hypothetical protein
MTGYSIDEHIHRFGVWTAARAASKSRLSNSELAELIDAISLRKKVENLRKFDPLTIDYYHQWIKETGNAMLKTVSETEYKKTKKENFKKDNFTFGLAAKIISIYIKTVEIVPSKGESPLSLIAYPPIDSILLKRINAVYGLNLRHQWSTFDWERYEETILKLRQLFPDMAMWRIEVNWSVRELKDDDQ